MITRISMRIASLPTKSRIPPRAFQPCTNLFKVSLSASQCLPNRYYSTPTPPSTEAPKQSDLRSNQNPTESPRPSDLRSQFRPVSQPLQTKPKRSLSRYIYATLFLMLGLTAGQYVRLVVAPPPLPLAGSKEDVLMVEYLKKQAEKLPIVQSLSADPAWESYDAYQDSTPESRIHSLTTGPLAGARALGGFQRIFHNYESGELVTVIWFGGAVAGWPGVTHGGLTATVMDEGMGRCAIHQLPSKTGVTANLSLNYLKPAITNSFYIIRAIPEKKGATEHKQWVTGRLETMNGRVCVEGRGLFVVAKKYETKQIGR